MAAIDTEIWSSTTKSLDHVTRSARGRFEDYIRRLIPSMFSLHEIGVVFFVHPRDGDADSLETNVLPALGQSVYYRGLNNVYH